MTTFAQLEKSGANGIRKVLQDQLVWLLTVHFLDVISRKVTNSFPLSLPFFFFKQLYLCSLLKASLETRNKNRLCWVICFSSIPPFLPKTCSLWLFFPFLHSYLLPQLCFWHLLRSLCPYQPPYYNPNSVTHSFYVTFSTFFEIDVLYSFLYSIPNQHISLPIPFSLHSRVLLAVN